MEMLSVVIMFLFAAMSYMYSRINNLHDKFNRLERMCDINYNGIETLERRLYYHEKLLSADEWTYGELEVRTKFTDMQINVTNRVMYLVTKEIIDTNKKFKYKNQLIGIVDVQPDADGYKYIVEYVDKGWD